MDTAVCLSTDASAESTGYEISTGTHKAWILESRVDQPTDESWSVIWWSTGNG